MLKRIAPVVIAGLFIPPIAMPVLAADDNMPKAPAQAVPAPKADQAPRSLPQATPMYDAPATRSLRRPAPTGPGGDGGRPDDTVGGLPGAKPTVPDK